MSCAEHRRDSGVLAAIGKRGTLIFGSLVAVLVAVLGGIYWNKSAAVSLDTKAPMTSELAMLPGSPQNPYTAPARSIGQDEARKLNGAIPFAPTAGKSARPFHFAGSIIDQSRAVDCLALAAMAEAGSDDDGQRAVIQVVLNRVLHPAFAKTICGVVFEGSHRRTGCQFTFTCDGALARRHSAVAWANARSRTIEALNGRVYAPVGLATHYHTDWVHPYWSDSLIKLARVGTHLFFRWPGRWGEAGALSAAYRGSEPTIAQLAYLPAHSKPGDPVNGQLVANQAKGGGDVHNVVVRNGDGGAFVYLAEATSAVSAREMGRSICMDRPSCKVFGWFDRTAIPPGYPVSAGARSKLGFSYFRDARNDEIVLYDCARFAGVADDGCIPATMARRPVGKPKPVSPQLAMTLPQAATGQDNLPISREMRSSLSWKDAP